LTTDKFLREGNMIIKLIAALAAAMILVGCGGGGGGAVPGAKDFTLPGVINAVPPQ
jgi:ABC-type glycerol-3-phosphate transport system substrate-binding protein